MLQSYRESPAEFGDGGDAKNGGGGNKYLRLLGQLAEWRDSGAAHLDENEENVVAEVVGDSIVRGNAHEGWEGQELTNHKLGLVVQVLVLELGVAVQLQPAVAHAFVRELRQRHELFHSKQQQLDEGRVIAQRGLASTLIKRVRGYAKSGESAQRNTPC